MHKPPKKLSREARALWTSIMEQYCCDDAAGVRLLLTACEALDSMRAAEAQVEKDGLTVTDRLGAPKAHPLLTVIRDSRAAMLTALRRLGLEPNPQEKRRPGHPPGGHGL